MDARRGRQHPARLPRPHPAQAAGGGADEATSQARLPASRERRPQAQAVNLPRLTRLKTRGRLKLTLFTSRLFLRSRRIY